MGYGRKAKFQAFESIKLPDIAETGNSSLGEQTPYISIAYLIIAFDTIQYSILASLKAENNQRILSDE
jgi:hypothetical protein